jgi:hypothetical protein
MAWHPVRDELDAIRSTDTDDCIIWTRSQSKGYPKARIGDRTVNLHRLLCEEANGPAPSNRHQATHSCGRSLCLNKRHLRWGTPKQNAADKMLHGTNNDGSRNGAAKLDWQAVQEIRQAQGIPQRALAARYGVSQALISLIRSGQVWAEERRSHVRPEPA